MYLITGQEESDAGLTTERGEQVIHADSRWGQGEGGRSWPLERRLSPDVVFLDADPDLGGLRQGLKLTAFMHDADRLLIEVHCRRVMPDEGEACPGD
nr:hypothetical protein [uncultured Halomonas sp.]